MDTFYDNCLDELDPHHLQRDKQHFQEVLELSSQNHAHLLYLRLGPMQTTQYQPTDLMF